MMTVEQEILQELKKRLTQLIKEKNLSFSQASHIVSLLSDEYQSVIKKRYP